MDTNNINKRLELVVAELQLIYDLVNQDEPDLPAEAQQLLEAGICLECRLPLEEKDLPGKRGCHEKCHRRVLRAIENGAYTEYDAISAGRLAPTKKGGRPPQKTWLEKQDEKLKNAMREKKRLGAVGRKKATKKGSRESDKE